MRPARAGRVVLTAVLLLAIGAGCSSGSPGLAPDDGGPTVPGGTGTTAGPGSGTGAVAEPAGIRWRSCGRGLQCAVVVAPLDHERPDAGTIELSVVRRPADGPDPVGTLVVNPGGPGASATDFVRAASWPDELTRAFDVVGVDPRGTGGSAPLQCASDPSLERFRTTDSAPDTAEAARRLEEAAVAVAEACAALDGDLLPHIGVTEAADDLDWVRRAMGVDSLNFLGFSWGTLLGLTYAERHGEHLDRLVLDGVVDPAVSLIGLLGDQAAGLEGLFTTFDAVCDSQPTCPVEGVVETYDRVEARLRRAGPEGPSPSVLRLATFAASYDRGRHRRFLTALAAADRGDYGDLEALAAAYSTAGDLAPYLAHLCRDHARPDDVAGWAAAATTVGATAPRLGPAVVNELLPCAAWPVPATPEDGTTVLPESVAVLVVGLTGDIATPYAYATAVHARLPGAALLTVEGDGHTAFAQSPCTQQAVVSFLRTGRATQDRC